MRPLNIFVPHCSDLLTDYMSHGDGLIAHGFISNLARRGHRLHVAAERVELRQRLHPNITVHLIEVKRRKAGLARLEYMMRMRGLFKKLAAQIQFDLIHQLNPVFSGMSLGLTGCGLPLVLGTYVARWPDGWRGPNSRAGWMDRVSSYARNRVVSVQQRQADALLLTTPAALNRIPDLKSVQNRIHVLPHGIDTELFSPVPDWDSNQRLLAEQQNPSILFFANVVRRKGIFTLIEAFPAVANAFPGCRLQIAGDGPDLVETKRRVADAKLSGKVDFLGAQERAAAPGLYRNSTIYCLPSFGEPYATTVIEAMSCARALVVTDSGGLPHLVKEDGGIKVRTGDPSALADGLIALLKEPEKRRTKGRFNRRLVETTMTWDRVAEQLEDVYEKSMDRFSSLRRASSGIDKLLFRPMPDAAAREEL
jgi:glycosyltransferase involved in cell wall biosynthesis